MAPVKFFTAFVLLSFRGQFFTNEKTLFWGLFSVLVLTYPAYLAQNSESLVALFQEWVDCVRSGDFAFGVEKTFGRENQGLPALVVRLLGAAGLSAEKYSLVSILVSVAGFISSGFFLLRKKLNDRELFVGSLALVPVFMPLSWFHGFVLVFPATCLLIQKNIKLGLTALFLVAVITSKTLGPVGVALEFLSVKSAGALVVLLF